MSNYSIYNNFAPNFLSDEWTLHANATAESAKRLVLNATDLDQFSRITAYVRAGSTFVIKGEITGDARVRISYNNSTNAIGGTWIADFWGGEKEFIVPADTNQIVLAFGQRAGISAGTYTLENLILRDPLATSDIYIKDSLKTDWLPTDYYHSDDLNRVDKMTEHVRDRVFDNTGDTVAIERNPNLKPVASDPIGFSAWYGNLSLESYTFKSGRVGFRAVMTDVATNPRFRVIGSWTKEYRANLTKGKRYMYSVIFQPSRDMDIMEFGSLYYDDPYITNFWQEFPAEYIRDMAVESEVDETYRYEISFVAPETATVRPSFGFGLSNPNIVNGSYINFIEWRIQEIDSELTYPTPEKLNRLESNLGELRTYLYEPVGTVEPKTNWVVNQFFSYHDSNRLEQNVKYTYDYFVTKAHSVPRCGQYTLTNEIGVL